MNLKQRAAALESKFLGYDAETQAEVITTAKVIFRALQPKPGGCPPDMLMGIFDLLQNVGGKMSRGMLGEAQALMELRTGAPTMSAKFLTAITE